MAVLTVELDKDLSKYADLTAADMGADRAAAIRAMRDEPGHVAEDVECTAEDVIVWCRIQGVL
jgi:hypothetical protein